VFHNFEDGSSTRSIAVTREEEEEGEENEDDDEEEEEEEENTKFGKLKINVQARVPVLI